MRLRSADHAVHFDFVAAAQGDAEDELHDERAEALAVHDLPRQHMLRRGPLSPRLLPALAIMASDHQQLQIIISGTAPLQVGD